MEFERVKINLQTPYNDGKLSVTSMTERGGELLITLANRECYDVFIGQTLVFHRWIDTEDGNYLDVSASVLVLNEDENHVIHTTLPPTQKYYFNKNLYGLEVDTISDVKYTILRFTDDHNIFAQDLDTDTGQEIYIKDYEGNLLASYSGLSIPILSAYGRYFAGGNLIQRDDGSKFLSGGTYQSIGNNKIVTREDCITLEKEEDTCGHEYDKYLTYGYYFLPKSFSRATLLVQDFNLDLYDRMAYMETKFNPFYFYETKFDEATGEEYHECHFYEDNWWYSLENGYHPLNEKYINLGPSSVYLSFPRNYWKIGVGLASTVDYDSMGGEEEYGEYIDRDIQENLVPKFIDMERVKYIPAIKDGEEFNIATSITMDFHFRKREMVTSATKNNNTPLTRGNVYVDGWSVNENDWNTAWWNGMDYDDKTFSSGAFISFKEESGSTSDLLGYLNFTDNDVFYNKMKVSESFVRLSFYTSPYIVDQKLLYYSTIFLDGTGLYGKFIRQLMFIEENGYRAKYAYDGENAENARVVFCENDEASARVDSELQMTNEYDRTRSSEGYNLYLFASDADIKDLGETDERTIYMKAEFNHAGNGKTIPMILNWPKEGDKYMPLTTENFIESLYTPIKIRKYNGKFIYYIPSADTDESGNIRLIFFEPKIDAIQD